VHVAPKQHLPPFRPSLCCMHVVCPSFPSIWVQAAVWSIQNEPNAIPACLDAAPRIPQIHKYVLKDPMQDMVYLSAPTSILFHFHTHTHTARTNLLCCVSSSSWRILCYVSAGTHMCATNCCWWIILGETTLTYHASYTTMSLLEMWNLADSSGGDDASRIHLLRFSSSHATRSSLAPPCIIQLSSLVIRTQQCDDEDTMQPITLLCPSIQPIALLWDKKIMIILFWRCFRCYIYIRGP
jgi:hypothetical protein